MAIKKEIYARFTHKHDLEVNWLRAENFVPLQGELIIYDVEINENGEVLSLPSGDVYGRTTPYTYERFKIGNGYDNVTSLPFVDETMILASTQVRHGSGLLSELIDTYILNIDYDTLLAFDTSEIVTGATSTTSVLGQAILGQMVLA